MNIRRSLSIAVEVALVILVFSLILGVVLGQPVLLSYVETGSMEPTLAPGDGFVAIPEAVAGPIEEGDVIVYEAEEIQGGGLITHRVVGETDRGFITSGDANPFTDQDSDEPPVKRAQVVAVVWQPGGAVLSLPGVGTVVTGTQGVLETIQRRLAVLLGTRSLLGVRGLAYLLFAATLVAYAVDLFRTRGQKERERTTSRRTGIDPRLWSAAFALLVVVAATAAMVAPAGTQEYGVISAEFDSERPTVIPSGETETFPYYVDNGGVLPVVAYLEAGGDDVTAESERVRVPPGESHNATVALTAPPETGYYRRYVVEHRYLAVLPAPVMDALYRVHPWAPIVAIDALLGGAFYLLAMRLVGTGRIRSNEREGPSTGRRILSRLP
jgi:signal peptidase